MRHVPFACLLALAVVPAVVPAAGEAAGPPQAWLFGSWVGGLYPVNGRPTAESCLAQPSVIFARDVVMRGTLTDVTYVQRVVVTARTHANRVEFTFVPQPPPASDGLLGNAAAAATPIATGFGCESPDVLHVERQGPDQIVFPGCADFPNPLVRCPSK